MFASEAQAISTEALQSLRNSDAALRNLISQSHEVVSLVKNSGSLTIRLLDSNKAEMQTFMYEAHRNLEILSRENSMSSEVRGAVDTSSAGTKQRQSIRGSLESIKSTIHEVERSLQIFAGDIEVSQSAALGALSAVSAAVTQQLSTLSSTLKDLESQASTISLQGVLTLSVAMPLLLFTTRSFWLRGLLG